MWLNFRVPSQWVRTQGACHRRDFSPLVLPSFTSLKLDLSGFFAVQFLFSPFLAHALEEN